MKEKKLSIIIPIYKCGKYIPDLLESFSGEKTDYVHFIFIDDNSPDNTIDIFEETIRDYNYSYELIVSEENIGLSAVRNLGLKHVKTPYVAFLDGDDWYEKRTLLIFEYLIGENPDIDVFIFDIILRRKFESGSAGNDVTKYITGGSELVYFNKYHSTCLKLYKKSVLNFEFDSDIFFEDFEAIAKVACQDLKVISTGISIYNYRIGNSSSMMGGTTKYDIYREYRNIYERHTSLLPREIVDARLIYTCLGSINQSSLKNNLTKLENLYRATVKNNKITQVSFLTYLLLNQKLTDREKMKILNLVWRKPEALVEFKKAVPATPVSNFFTDFFKGEAFSDYPKEDSIEAFIDSKKELHLFLHETDLSDEGVVKKEAIESLYLESDVWYATLESIDVNTDRDLLEQRILHSTTVYHLEDINGMKIPNYVQTVDLSEINLELTFRKKIEVARSAFLILNETDLQIFLKHISTNESVSKNKTLKIISIYKFSGTCLTMIFKMYKNTEVIFVDTYSELLRQVDGFTRIISCSDDSLQGNLRSSIFKANSKVYDIAGNKLVCADLKEPTTVDRLVPSKKEKRIILFFVIVADTFGGVEAIIINMKKLYGEDYDFFVVATLDRNIPSVFRKHGIFTINQDSTYTDELVKKAEIICFPHVYPYTLSEKYRKLLSEEAQKIRYFYLGDAATLAQSARTQIGTFTQYKMSGYMLNDAYVNIQDVAVLSTKSADLLTSRFQHTRFKYLPNLVYQDTSVVLPERSKDFVYMGRLETVEKNINAFIDIAKLLPDHIAIDLYGKGTDEDIAEFTRKINRNNLQGKIRLKGFIEPIKVQQTLSKYKALLMVSKREGLPNVVFESLNVATPVVMFDSFLTANEIIKDNVNGFLIDPFNHEAYAKKVIEIDLMSDEEYKDFSVRAFNSRKKDEEIIEEWNEFLRVEPVEPKKLKSGLTIITTDIIGYSERFIITEDQKKNHPIQIVKWEELKAADGIEYDHFMFIDDSSVVKNLDELIECLNTYHFDVMQFDVEDASHSSKYKNNSSFGYIYKNVEDFTSGTVFNKVFKTNLFQDFYDKRFVRAFSLGESVATLIEMKYNLLMLSKVQDSHMILSVDKVFVDNVDAKKTRVEHLHYLAFLYSFCPLLETEEDYVEMYDRIELQSCNDSTTLLAAEECFALIKQVGRNLHG